MANSRRRFLKQAAGVTAACLFSGTDSMTVKPAIAQVAQDAKIIGNPGWYDRPMRWAQLAFVEDDPGNYDQAFWLEYFQTIHADAACLSAGGSVAFYPTEIPLHYRSKWLGDRDSFGDLMQGCRKLGMNVVARTDAHAARQEVYDEHPDWIAVDAKGNKKRHPSDPDFWITCALGPYNFDFMTRVHEEIMTKYLPDGIFTNRWAGSGMCYCEHCRENFHAFSGLDLPRTLNPQDPARRQYIVWHQQQLFALWRLWNEKIRAINPNASYLANAGGGALSDLDMKTIGELAPTLFADRQARTGLMAPWANGKNGKEYRATLGQKAIAGIFSVGLEEKYRWKDSVQSGDEIRLWVADGIAQDLRPWFVKFNAKPIDKRWLPVVQEIYQWHHAHQDYLRNERSFARVAIVYSQQTASYYGGEDARAKVEDPALGFYQALVEARIPFEMVHDHLLDPEHLDRFQTLILPNVAALSTQQCEQLRSFVQRGGGLVATYESSLYDEWGVRRSDFGLADLFGTSFTGREEGPLLNSYLTLEKDAAHPHPLLEGFDDVTRMINGAHSVSVTALSGDASSPLMVVPSYPDLPMEEVFVRPSATRQPGTLAHQFGRGRVVYFPADLDRTFWEVLDLDQGKLLRNAVLWATNEPAPVTVKGKGVLDLSIWGQKRSMTVHLVNLTNPMMMKGPLREVIPITEQELTIRIPEGKKVTQVRLLVAGGTVRYRREEDTLRLTVPSIGVHEVVAVDLST